MTVNQEVKGTLAKLMATENLTVEHRKVPTAYFEVDKRILCLPIWKDVTGDVYDLLVGHEVGHALYTPMEYGDQSKLLPQDILNVLEDVRVEKLMKRRYPGLSKSFYNGYKELDEKNFFELEDKDISKMSFIDRINIHYKVGVFGSRTIVPFSNEEMVYVNKASQTESFEDIIQLTEELVEYLKMKKQEQMEMEQPSPTSISGGGQGDGDDEQECAPMPGNQSDSLGSSSNQQQSGSEDDGDESTDGMSAPSGVGGRSPIIDEFTSETAQALADKLKNLVDRYSKEHVYLDTPTFNLNNTIISYSKISEIFVEHFARESQKTPKIYETIRKSYQKYKKDSIKTVNYLVKEFECKKAADQYHRATTSNTGVLNTQKLHTYKWNEDLFKKVTTLPDGKNHGLVFYLDWSGSMANPMMQTIKQLFDLVWFCKKVSIPFRVYGFSDSYTNSYMSTDVPVVRKNNSIHVDTSFRLLEFLSSKMNAKQLDKQMEYFWYQAEAFRGQGNYAHQLCLSGTPLAETILSTPQVVDQFKNLEKVQKVNVIYLTDGEAAYPEYTKNNGSQAMYGDKVYILRDPKSRYSRVMNLDTQNITTEFISFMQGIVDFNIVGFRLCSRSEMRHFAQLHEIPLKQIAELEKQWEKNKSVCIPNCGFDELYMMPLPKSARPWWDQTPDDGDTTKQIVVKGNATSGQLSNAFKDHMKSKMTNKVILSKFIAQIA
ncbi:RNA binding protein [Synechococcus phage S-CREM1]|nr:RNA binding protein [Synechococcus phage S-CREM1]